MYPIQTVYDMYAAAVNDRRRDMLTFAQIARITGVSAREMDEKSAKSINKAWEGMLKALEPSRLTQPKPNTHKRAPGAAPSAQASSVTSEQAASVANVFLSTGTFTPVKK